MAIRSDQLLRDPTTQSAGWEIPPRVAAINRRDFRRQDLIRIRDLAESCLDFGKRAGFWVWNNWFQNNAEAGASRLTWETPYLDDRGARVKRLVCGESAHFMLQRLMVHAGNQDYYSDLYAYLAVAKGSLDFWRSDANFLTKFHVWVEIASSVGGAPLLKIDLWAAGTNAGPLFPDGAPLDCIRTEIIEDFALASGRSPGNMPGP